MGELLANAWHSVRGGYWAYMIDEFLSQTLVERNYSGGGRITVRRTKDASYVGRWRPDQQGFRCHRG